MEVDSAVLCLVDLDLAARHVKYYVAMMHTKHSCRERSPQVTRGKACVILMFHREAIGVGQEEHLNMS